MSVSDASHASPELPAEMAAPKPAVTKPTIGAYRRHLLICTGSRCTQDGAAQALFDSLGDKFKAAGLHEGDWRVKRSRVSCFAACKGGPIVCVQPDGTWYYNVTDANMDRIIVQHLVGGQVVPDLVFHQGPGGAAEPENGGPPVSVCASASPP